MSIAPAGQVLQLLDSVRVRSAALQEAQKRYADQLAPAFHLVDHLRNDEMALSRYLALLLDVNGSHGQGDLFLRKLAERAGPCAAWMAPHELVRVALEKQANGQRRLDIYLEFRNGVMGVENKPWADDQPEQLTDYAGFLAASAAGRHWLLLYVCNEEPSEHSISAEALQDLADKGHYCRVDFHQLADWLEHCASLTRAPKVRLFAEELVVYVRREINGEMEMTEVEEIKSLILEKDEYIASAFQVSASMSRLKEQLLAELKEELGRELRMLGMIPVWDDVLIQRENCYAGFGARLHPAHKVQLRFEFGATGLDSLEWGICRNGKDITLDPAKASLIRRAMVNAFGEGYDSPFWPWYPGQGSQDKELAADERHWRASPVPWLRIRDKTDRGFVKRFVALAVKVRAALADVHDAMC